MFGGEDRGSLARAMAIAGFWLSDMFINMAQLPARTLLVDLLPQIAELSNLVIVDFMKDTVKTSVKRFSC